MNARLIPLALLLGFCAQAHAQLKVELKIPHRLYVAYEPILASVTVTNLTGRDINFEDAGGNQWFGFQIATADDTPVPPRDLNYKLTPFMLEAGQSMKRTVNLIPLFPMTEFGLYRVRATIYFSGLNRYFTSQPQNIEVTEGKTIWQQTVGVPEGAKGDGGYRVFTVMTHRLTAETRIYVRVEDKEKDLVYLTSSIGKLALAEAPEIMLDEANLLHVMHRNGPRTFMHTTVGLNGEPIEQNAYSETKTRPRLHQGPGRKVGVIGGKLDAPVALPAGALPQPKLSDPPPGLPKL